MENRELIIAYAEGKLTNEEFETELWIRSDLWDDIQKLLPADIDEPN